MAFENVPWVVGGGAHIGPEVARILANAATGGLSGCVSLGDLFVAPLAVPGGQVRILPGAFVAASNFSGAARQSYIGTALSETVVDIPPQGSSGARVDLLIAEISDPQYVGSTPPDPDLFDYARPRLIQNVSAAVAATPNSARDYLRTQGITGAPLARINMPASTATVGGGPGNGTVSSLRELVQPRSQRILWAHAMVSGDPDQFLTTTATDGEYFPNIAFNTEIPSWATRVKIIAQVNQVLIPLGTNAVGGIKARLGADASPIKLTTQETGFDTNGSTTNTQRYTLTVADDIAVPANARGTVQHTHIRGRYTGSAPAGAARFKADAHSSLYIDLQFEESAADFSL